MTHTVVVDLGYGDAGKGTVTDWLCATQPVRAVVRFNGGAQAAHNVLTPDGRQHTFAQFGSGSLHGVPTHLSRFMLVEPLALAAEAEHLRGLGLPDPCGLLTVDRRALLTTPDHAVANRCREQARGADRHGSCGVGIGETVRWALDHPDLAPVVADTLRPARLRRKLRALREAVLAEHPQLDPAGLAPLEPLLATYRAFADAVTLVDESHLATELRRGPVVFEGAQGVLLDEWHGFHPHTTWSTTTAANAQALLAEADQGGQARVLGVLRAYTTRHGAGPLVTEDVALTAALPEAHNGAGRWQGPFRVGHFDAVAHRYALAVAGGVDAVALTHLDRVAGTDLRLVTGYTHQGAPLTTLPPGARGDRAHQEALTALVRRCAPGASVSPGARDWAAAVGDALGVPVALSSHGPTWADKAVLAPARAA